MQDEKVCHQIAQAVSLYAAGSTGASQTAGRVIECVIGATLPMVGSMFQGGEPQEKLLFTLILAGACANVSEHGGNFRVEVSVSPNTIREAFDIFTRLTGKEIQSHLPKTMLDFAAKEQGFLH